MSKQERINEVNDMLSNNAWEDLDLGQLQYVVRVHPNADTVKVAKQQMAIINRYRHSNGTVMTFAQADACYAARKSASGN